VEDWGTQYVDAYERDSFHINQAVEQYLPGKTKLVFLDACRDNPLMASGARGVTKGLAPINVSEGTLISYATKDGQTADDGAGQTNSPFTAALLEHLSDPEDIAVVLRNEFAGGIALGALERGRKRLGGVDERCQRHFLLREYGIAVEINNPIRFYRLVVVVATHQYFPR
jgi:hypothetical protein